MSSDEGSDGLPRPQLQPKPSTGLGERRRLRRELHNSAASLIDAIGLVLNRLSESDDPEITALVRECDEVIREITGRLRTLERGEDA